MRLEVFCHDRLGLTRELLDLLVAHNIDLRGIEIDPAGEAGRIYLHFATLSFSQFSSLMAEIRRITGITDVRTVAWMPSERKHRALSVLLTAVSDPVLSIDIKGKIELANAAAQQLFSLNESKLRSYSVSTLIPEFNVLHRLEASYAEVVTEHVVIQGRHFLLEATPIYADSENENGSNALSPVGAVMLLKSTARIVSPLQDLAVHDNSGFEHIIAVSPKMRHITEQARKLAMLDAPLLITGETGTGKDILAHACHLRSPRGGKPFLALNCASLPDDVAESELFGHATGAYPNALEGKKGFFEQANGGSVLLDEIGEMTPRMQVKLLRFLNDGTFRRVGEEDEVHVDVRVICATQKNLMELVQRGEFREDLFYRLNVLTLNLPPLCERLPDILPLTEMFVARFAQEQRIIQPRLSPQLHTFLNRYSWPGNVRQLKNVLYRALTQLEDNELRPQDIILPEQSVDRVPDDEVLEGTLDEITGRFESAVLSRLYLSYPSTRKLAKRLGVSHTAIANKLREYGLSTKKSDAS
ncbi:transcriptional regulator TyrR [Enterobacteriaceae bacterium LUAb1]